MSPPSSAALSALALARRVGGSSTAATAAALKSVVVTTVSPTDTASWAAAVSLLDVEGAALAEAPEAAAVLASRLRCPPAAWPLALRSLAVAAGADGTNLRAVDPEAIRHAGRLLATCGAWQAAAELSVAVGLSGAHGPLGPRLRQSALTAALTHGAWGKALRFHRHACVRHRDPPESIPTGHLLRLLEDRGRWAEAARVLEDTGRHLQQATLGRHAGQQWSETVGVGMNAAVGPVFAAGPTWHAVLRWYTDLTAAVPQVGPTGQVLRFLGRFAPPSAAAALRSTDAVPAQATVIRMAAVGQWVDALAVLADALPTLTAHSERRCRGAVLGALSKRRAPWEHSLRLAHALAARRNVSLGPDEHRALVMSAVHHGRWDVAMRLFAAAYAPRSASARGVDPGAVGAFVLRASPPWDAAIRFALGAWRLTAAEEHRAMLMSAAALRCYDATVAVPPAAAVLGDQVAAHPLMHATTYVPNTAACAVGDAVVRRMVQRSLCPSAAVLLAAPPALFEDAAREGLVASPEVVHMVRKAGEWRSAARMAATAIRHASSGGVDAAQCTREVLWRLRREHRWEAALAVARTAGAPTAALDTVWTTVAVAAVEGQQLAVAEVALRHAAVVGCGVDQALLPALLRPLTYADPVGAVRVAEAALALIPDIRAAHPVGLQAVLAFAAALSGASTPPPPIVAAATEAFHGLARDPDTLRPENLQHAVTVLAAAPKSGSGGRRREKGLVGQVGARSLSRGVDAWAAALECCASAHRRGVLIDTTLEVALMAFPDKAPQTVALVERRWPEVAFRVRLKLGLE